MKRFHVCWFDRVSPGIVVATAVVLVSLIGLPPLAGFVEVSVFSSLVDAPAGAESPLMLSLLIGGFNTVVSLFYYLRVLKVMTFDPLPEDRVRTVFVCFNFWGNDHESCLARCDIRCFLVCLYAAAHLAGVIAS